MLTKSPTDGQSVPTSKQAFFLLNPEAKLSDLLIHSGSLIARLQDLISATQNLQQGVDGSEEWLLSLLSSMRDTTNQLDAIYARFMQVEREAGKPPRLSTDRQAQFLARLQKQSNTKLNFPGSDYSASPENFQLYQRQANLDGMLELIELLAGVGVQVPAIVASIVESETGRIG